MKVQVSSSRSAWKKVSRHVVPFNDDSPIERCAWRLRRPSGAVARRVRK